MSAFEADCGVCGYSCCLLDWFVFLVGGLACILVSVFSLLFRRSCMLVFEVNPGVCGYSGCPW